MADTTRREALAICSSAVIAAGAASVGLGVRRLFGTSFNSGVIATNEGVVVLDALTSEGIARQERETIASVIKQPVRFLVSATFHNNYTWGNVAYQSCR